MTKKTTILSIDGWGVRGILPCVILSYIKERLRAKEGDQVRLSDYFDLMAGTSTGGILTCLYVTPGEDGRPKFTAQEAVNLYLNNGAKIFSIPFGRKIFSWFGLIEAQYPVANLERILHSFLGDLKLSLAMKPCLITAYEICQRNTVKKTDRFYLPARFNK